MHGFVNSPALAKLIALQMIDEEINRNRRPRRKRTSRQGLRWLRRSSARPVPNAADAEPAVMSRRAQGAFLNHRAEPLVEEPR